MQSLAVPGRAGRRLRVAVLALLFLGAQEAAPDPAPGADVHAVQAWEALVSAHVANGDFSGVLLVSRHGQVVFEKHAGLAAPAFGVPVAADTRFLVASVTKTFTAAAIALLEKGGKLAITDGLERSLPQFAHADEIKLWHLLGHQSGLANPDYEALAARDVSPDELLALIGAQPLQFEPGSSSRYSNAGYIVLARVVEVVSGQAFGDFLARHVFEPLGMAGSGTLRSGAVEPRLAEGFVPGVGTALLRAQPRDPSALFGSGCVVSTAADLDRWLTAVDRHELFDITQQPYPFGWGQRTWFDKHVLVQSGMTNGYCSIILTVPADELHIVALLNMQSGFTADEGESLLGIALGHAATAPPRRPAPPAMPPATLERLAGLYLWGEGKVPMHLETDGHVLTLRWASSASVVPLTPLSESEFLDRTSFGRALFAGDGLIWTQNGSETPAPRAPHEASPR